MSYIEDLDVADIMRLKEKMDMFLFNKYRKRYTAGENMMIDLLLLDGYSIEEIMSVISNFDYKEIVNEYRRFQEQIASTFMDMIMMDADIDDKASLYNELIKNTSVKGISKEEDQKVINLDLNYKKVLRKVRKEAKGGTYE